jgi:hypothetical protein
VSLSGGGAGGGKKTSLLLLGEENLGHPYERKYTLEIHPKRGRKLVKSVEHMAHSAM